ncbi:LPD38 domain-containing protein [Marinobacter sp. OP 3.4]|uniref:LPD38 domain-containing protein n=1 Tax=Marinobacter sp. OP 3.4 TaxID=3076501 RepID=UPI002E246037
MMRADQFLDSDGPTTAGSQPVTQPAPASADAFLDAPDDAASSPEEAVPEQGMGLSPNRLFGVGANQNPERFRQQPQPENGQQYDSFLEATGKSLDNVPERLQQSFGGLVQMLGEDMDQERERHMQISAQRLGISPNEYKALAWAGREGIIDPETPIPEALDSLKSRMSTELTPEQQQVVADMGIINPQEIAESGEKTRRDAQADMVPVNAEPGSPEYYTSTAIASIAEMTPALFASAVTRNPAVGMSIIGGQVTGESYGTGRDEGLSVDESQRYAVAQAAAEAIPEYLPISRIIKPGTNFFKKLAEAGAAESVQEGITAALQAGIDKGTIHPDMTWGEARQLIQDGMIVGGIAGPGMAAITEPLVRLRNQQQSEPGGDTGDAPPADAPVGGQPIAEQYLGDELPEQAPASRRAAAEAARQTGGGDGQPVSRNLQRDPAGQTAVETSAEQAEPAVVDPISVLPEPDQDVVNRRFSEPETRDAAIQVFDRVKPATSNQRELAAIDVEISGDQGELAAPRVQVLDSLRQTLNANKSLRSRLQTAFPEAEQGGRIPGVTATSSNSMNLIARAIQQPEVNDSVNRAAQRISQGESRADVLKDLRSEIASFESTAVPATQSQPTQDPTIESAAPLAPVETGQQTGQEAPLTNDQADVAQPVTEQPEAANSPTDNRGDEQAAAPIENPRKMDLVTDEAGKVDINASVEALGPVPQGYTRLYRASSPTVGFEDVFEKEGLEQFQRGDLKGKRYTNDPSYAEYFRSTYGNDATIEVRDVASEGLEDRAVNDYEFIVDDGERSAQSPAESTTDQQAEPADTAPSQEYEPESGRPNQEAEPANTQPEAASSQQDDPPLFSARRGRGQRRQPLPRRQVENTVNQFFRKYQGADDVRTKIHDSAETLPGYNPERDAGDTIAGQFEPRTNTVHLVANAYDRQSQIRETLQEEILVHKGLGFFKPEDRQQLYRDIQKAAAESQEVAQLWEQTVRDYESVAETASLNEEQANRLYAEELLGTLAQRKVNWLSRGWRTLRNGLKRLLVRAGWVRDNIGADELRSRIDLIARAFEHGRRAPRRNFTQDIRGNQPEAEQAPPLPEVGEITDESEAQRIRDRFNQGPGQQEVRGRSLGGGQTREGWQEETRITDRAGRPLLVFRGASRELTAEDFSAERRGFATKHPSASLGTFFTHSDIDAQRYGAVRPYFLDVRNPYLIEGSDLPGFNSPQEAEQFRNDLEARGYDGIVIDYTDLGGPQHIVPFAPESVIIDDDVPMFSRMGNRLDHAADHFDDLDADQRTALGKIAPKTPREKASDWLAERLDRWATKLRQGIVDRFAALKDVDEALYGQDVVEGSTASSSWVLAQMAGAASGALQSMLTTSRIKLNTKEGVITLREDSERGLNDTLKQLGTAAEIERFFGWIAGNRSARLMEDGRENLFTPEEVDALKRLNEGKTESGQSRKALYNKVFRQFQEYRDDVLEIAAQTGIITQEQRETWANEFYVPFYRLADKEGGFTGPKSSGGISRQEAYKRLKGGRENLNDLLENTMMNFHHLLQASLKNQAALQAMENAEDLGIAREVREAERTPENSTFVLRDGRKIWYEIDDPLVFKAVSALSHPGMNSTMLDIMRKFKRLFTNMITTTPTFILRNLIRDTLQALATSPVAKNPLRNAMMGAKTYGNGRTRAQMMASGGSFSFGHLYGENADEMRLQITGALGRAEVLRSPSMVPATVKALWRQWNNVTDFTENVNRAAIYAQNVEERGELYAAFQARDLMNFSQYGSWPAVRILIDVVPFMNARLQGLDKIYRSGVKPAFRATFGQGNATDAQIAKRFWAVAGTLALVSIANYLRNYEDDEYKRLEEWQKDTYWFIRLSEDHAIFVPKPFEVGAIATMAERVTEQFVNEEATGKLFRQRLGHMLTDTFSFSPVPQVAAPLLDVYSNYDAFTGRPIESQGMQRMRPSLRMRPTTTEPAKWVSSGVEMLLGPDNSLTPSPVQVDHLIQGYFGSVGSWMSGVGDTIIKGAQGETEPAKRWYEYNPIRSFYKNLGDEEWYTRYGTVFYEALKEVNRVHADIQEYRELGQMEQAEELIEQNRSKLALRRMLNSTQRDLSKINKRMEQINRAEKSAEWKRRELDRMKAIRNRLQERAGRLVEQVESREG